ncbi:hypothetical protein BS50DRAFT_199161 [Corynespora cassiicola Philippines]|uniref:Uncharacterized protein n=1 Tax=Corynespora cassiicola Philippines TaxID=1448308 RepID=A0A2T2N616_CORCC|nr:hypothetical protein BS50DRAFT_199161 [Corynespora cassiicola Philippines]
MRRKAKSTTHLSHAEFEALPYSVQRKYFSELERLRIAEQTQEHQGPPPPAPDPTPNSNSPATNTSRRSSRAATITLPRPLTLGSTRRRLRKAETRRQEHELAQADAQFFLSLPEKLRKQHFSREEQVLLVGHCDHPPLPNGPELERAQRFNDFRFDFYHVNGHPRRGRSRRRSSSTSSVSPHYRPSEQEQEQEQEEERNRNRESSLLYLDIMSPPLSYQAAPTGFRRTLSLTSMPIRNSTSSAPPMDHPSLFSPTGLPWHQRSHSQSVTGQGQGQRSSHTPVAPVFDPEATHYTDPEARKKLRMFLASPQKFDEAVEFGFPSSSAGDDNSIGPRYTLPPIRTDARNFSKDMQTFLNDDKVSFLEDEEEDKGLDSDGDSMADLESPITPSSIGLSFRGHRRQSPSQFSSMDSTGLPPLHPMTGRLNREMTLRMTLTRPDLRADEDQLYGWQGQKPERAARDDPLALEELNLTDDMTGTKGAFYVKPKPQGNLVSRLFKRASRKGR